MTVLVHGVGETRPPFATLSAMWGDAASTMPGAVALRHLHTAFTDGQESRAAAALAHRIAAVAPAGSTIALVMPNLFEFRAAYLAALNARLIPALLNPLHPRRVTAWQGSRSRLTWPSCVCATKLLWRRWRPSQPRPSVPQPDRTTWRH